MDKAKANGGISHVFTQGAKMLLESGGHIDKPYWFVEDKDYSHLEVKERLLLVQFGYQEHCTICGGTVTIGDPCSTCLETKSAHQSAHGTISE